MDIIMWLHRPPKDRHRPPSRRISRRSPAEKIMRLSRRKNCG